jgi:hypothetical protein
MTGSLKLHHIRMFGVLIMLIGLFLISSMVLIAWNHSFDLMGVVFKMFIVGTLAGFVITFIGTVLFQYPTLGQWGADES